MERKNIGIIVAMPEEARPIMRRFGSCREERAGRFPVYYFTAGGRRIAMIRSGMGTNKATAATEQLIAVANPCVIISAGFGGAVRPGLDTGDVVIADQYLFLDKESPKTAGTLENEPLLNALREPYPTRPFRIVTGATVTTGGIIPKKSADHIIPREVTNPLLDMETSAVALVASRNGIPLVAVRAVSDPADEELLFSLDEITDRDLNISLIRVFLAIAKKPRILPQMLRLAKNAKRAGKNLALVVEQVAHVV
ncbi:MAG TPA: phosphorylase [Geobacteraceae bacterium]|nr:phosphorylase [Geobacteraceae bacterium]